MPSTEAYFHFTFHEKHTTTSANGTVTSDFSFAIAEGYVKLSGVGGLCVDNVLAMEVKMVLNRNSFGSPKSYIFNNPTYVILEPIFGYQPSSSIDLMNPPEAFRLNLSDSNNWHNSGNVVFFISGARQINATFVVSDLEQMSLVSPDSIQISDESVYVSKVNDEYVITLSLLVIALTCLQFRTEKGVRDTTNNGKSDGEASENAIDDKKVSGNKGNPYSKGRNKHNYRKRK